MDKNRDEQAIFLKDMLFAVLYQWRKMLLAAVAFALVLGGVKGITAWRSAADPKLVASRQESNRVALEKYETEKGIFDCEIADLDMRIENQENYLKESVLMKLDPYNVYEGSVCWYIDADYKIMPGMMYQDPDKSNAILLAYQSYLESDEVISRIADAVGLESKYLRELVSVSAFEDGQNQLVVDASCFDEAGVETILSLMMNYAEDASESIAQSVEEHTLRLVSDSRGIQIDLKLADTQKSEHNRLSKLLQERSDKILAFDGFQKPKTVDFSKKAAVMSGIKFGIVGAVLGIAVVVLAACIGNVAGNKVYSSRVLQYRYGLKILGSVALPCKDPAERWLKKKEGRAAPNDQPYEIVAANIRGRIGDMKRILLAGDVSTEMAEQAAQSLTPGLSGVEILPCGSLLHSAEALDQLAGCDAVVLMEVCGQSKYSNVCRELELIRDFGKTVAGCIVLE